MEVQAMDGQNILQRENSVGISILHLNLHEQLHTCYWKKIQTVRVRIIFLMCSRENVSFCKLMLGE